MHELPRQTTAQPEYSGTHDGLDSSVPVYLEYSPAGWPDALPPRRSYFGRLRWDVLKRIATGAKVLLLLARNFR